MNELAKMGFVYDVTYIKPNGDTQHQQVHNTMINQGLSKLIQRFFNIKNHNTSPYYMYGFMENNYTPNKEDKTSNGALDLYGWDVRMFVAYKRTVNPFVMGIQKDICPTENILSDSNISEVANSGVTFSFPEITVVFDGYKTITGCFLMQDTSESGFGTNLYYYWYYYGSYTLAGSKKAAANAHLLSAALFPEPLQVEPKGIVKVKAGFTAITA